MTAPAIRLPAVLDTLAALRLPALLTGDTAMIDASGVRHIGFAALQWLAGERARRGGALAIAPASAVFAERARDGGFALALLEEPPGEDGGRARTIRLADAALDFGREPLDALAVVRAAGARIEARPRLRAETAPDIIAFDILVRPPPTMDDEAIGAAFAAFDGAYALVADDSPAPRGSEPAAGLSIAPRKLARLNEIAGELEAAQAVLVHALGPARAALSAEIGEVDRLWRILQSAVADLGAAPIADLLGLPAHGWTWRGEALEIERIVMERVRAPLLATLAASGGGGISADRDAGFAIVTLTPAPAADAALAAAIGAAGGRIDDARDDALTFRLPRSLSMIDALVVAVGPARYALPVAHMVEALRPERDALHRLGSGEAMLRFGDGYVPIVAIGAAFGLAGWEADPERAVLVVTNAARGRVALLADAIVDQRQVTVKPIEGIAAPPGTLGAAIVGGDRVALAIDVDTLDPSACGRAALASPPPRC